MNPRQLKVAERLKELIDEGTRLKSKQITKTYGRVWLRCLALPGQFTPETMVLVSAVTRTTSADAQSGDFSLYIFRLCARALHVAVADSE